MELGKKYYRTGGHRSTVNEIGPPEVDQNWTVWTLTVNNSGTFEDRRLKFSAPDIPGWAKFLVKWQPHTPAGSMRTGVGSNGLQQKRPTLAHCRCAAHWWIELKIAVPDAGPKGLPKTRKNFRLARKKFFGCLPGTHLTPTWRGAKKLFSS